jgi:nucleoside-diphosphate-sugar epimerase
MNLITGGTGFLGAHLAASLLRHNQSVTIFRRKDSSLSELKRIFKYHFTDEVEKYFKMLSFSEGDIMIPEDLMAATENINHVYHCAAMVSFDKCDRKKMFDINVGGTRNLVNVLLSRPDIKMCHVSSIAALGRIRNGVPLDESSVWEKSPDNSSYSETKYFSELEVWRGIAEGLDAVIVLPGVILGPGDWSKGSSAMFKLVNNKLKFYTTGTNGFVGVEDVAEIMIQLMKSEITENRFILTSENISYRDLFEKIAAGLGKKLPQYNAGPLLRKIVVLTDAFAAKLTGKSRRFSDDFARLAGLQVKYDSTKITKILNVEFTPLSDCINKTCTFFLSENHE